MKFLVIGCGSIGERHTKNLLSSGQEVFVFDKDEKKMEYMAKKYTVQSYDILSYYVPMDAFIICVPPVYHLQYAQEAIKYNSHIFIEKPISNRLEGIDSLIQDAKDRNLIIQVGYQFRFHPGLRLAKKLLDEGRIGRLLSIRAEFGQYLPDWHPDEDYRNLYTAHEDQGGGIILDSSHEIDYVRWLAGNEVMLVSCFADKLSNLEVDTEDTAEINLRFENGVIGNIHVDFTQRYYTRTCKLIGETGNLTWSFPLNQIRFNYQPMDMPIQDELRYDFPIHPDTIYFEEMKHFISCLEGKEKPIIDGETGKRVLEIALAAKESAKMGLGVKV